MKYTTEHGKMIFEKQKNGRQIGCTLGVEQIYLTKSDLEAMIKLFKDNTTKQPRKQ